MIAFPFFLYSVIKIRKATRNIHSKLVVIIDYMICAQKEIKKIIVPIGTNLINGDKHSHENKENMKIQLKEKYILSRSECFSLRHAHYHKINN